MYHTFENAYMNIMSQQVFGEIDIRSVAVANGKVVDPQKKALLMNELFGAKIQTEVANKQVI
jgi:hypothetical protein